MKWRKKRWLGRSSGRRCSNPLIYEPAEATEPMAVKKSELYSSLWKTCDELRGGMDASQYKDYVLVLLFVKYVSGCGT